MQWKDIANLIGKAAPAVGTLIGGPIGAVVGQGLSLALGVKDEPSAVADALKNDPKALVKIKQYQIDHKYDLEKMHLQAAMSERETDTKNLETINATIRSEMSQQDNYTKRWRPTMGYAVTFSWVATWLAIVYTIVFNINKAQPVILAITQTTTLWGVALSILGISVWKRSTDKQVLAGGTSGGITGGIGKIISAIKPAKLQKL